MLSINKNFLAGCALLWMLTGAFALAYADEVEVILKPEMRAEPLTSTVREIRTNRIHQYLENMVVFDTERQFEALPYVLGFANSVTLGSSGDTAYATGIRKGDNLSSYTFLKPLQLLIDPKNGENLGLLTLAVGTAEMNQYAKPQSLKLINSIEYIAAGFRLVPREGLYVPAIVDARRPDESVYGYVLYVQTTSTGVGNSSIIVVSLGTRDGIEQGHLLDLMDSSKNIVDLYTNNNVKIQPTKFGEIIIYKAMEKVSLGYITSATRPVLVNDLAVAPPVGS